MSRSINLLAVPHELQGDKFPNFVEDPDYKILVERLISGIDFVFEEAGGCLPSIAQEFAKSIHGVDHYLDVDSSGSERAKFGIGQTEYCNPIDQWSTSEAFWKEMTGEHRKREELWLKRIQGQNFHAGLLICGVAHSLSFTFRLQDAGLDVETYHYLPYRKLCTRQHAE